MSFDVIIVGGGIVGFSTAFQLLQHDNTLKVAVLEKESEFAMHQTGHNSGVIHAGVYYPPGSLKAKFCIEGCREIQTFADEHNIPYQILGKIITALDEHELEWMEHLIDRCEKNGLTTQRLTVADAQKMQPGLSTIDAFFVEETGIINWRKVCQKYAEIFERLGGTIFYDEQVVSIVETAQDVTLRTQNNNVYTCDRMIACAGLYADRIAKMSGLNPSFQIVPFRGEYYRLDKTYDDLIKHLIYPVPNPKLPFLGVHYTPQVGGFTTVGPSAVLALAREGYGWKNIDIKDCVEIFTSSSVWKLLARNMGITIDQLISSIYTPHYIKSAQRYFPEIPRQAFSRYPAGVRAQAVADDGTFIKDFLFMQSDRTLHTCNAPSPAATSSLPIGRHILEQFLA